LTGPGRPASVRSHVLGRPLDSPTWTCYHPPSSRTRQKISEKVRIRGCNCRTPLPYWSLSGSARAQLSRGGDRNSLTPQAEARNHSGGGTLSPPPPGRMERQRPSAQPRGSNPRPVRTETPIPRTSASDEEGGALEATGGVATLRSEQDREGSQPSKLDRQERRRPIAGTKVKGSGCHPSQACYR
jgi:hypothetical protein